MAPRTQVKEKAQKQTKQVQNPDVSGIDYRNLKGENWANYQEIERKLFMHDHYDYEQHTARPIKLFRLNEVTGGREQYIAGIDITSAKPLMLTRISARDARILNEQISNTGKYFLISKTEKPTE